MNAISPITAKRPTTELLADQKPDARLKAFEAEWEALFDRIADDRAYADCDTDLDRRFMAAKHAVENLIKGCDEHLEWAAEQEPLGTYDANACGASAPYRVMV